MGSENLEVGDKLGLLRGFFILENGGITHRPEVETVEADERERLAPQIIDRFTCCTVFSP